MVMPPIMDHEPVAAEPIAASFAAAAGAAGEETRKPAKAVVLPPAAACPELADRPRRRTFTAKDKLRILEEADRAAGTLGAIGAILRREGIYSSALTDWRRQRAGGAFAALSASKRGPKQTEPNPLAGELEHRQQNPSRILLGPMLKNFELAHFRTQNRDDTFVENALAKLLRDNKRLALRVERAEAVIAIQKKVALLLGLQIETDEKS